MGGKVVLMRSRRAMREETGRRKERRDSNRRKNESGQKGKKCQIHVRVTNAVDQKDHFLYNYRR